MAPLLMQAGLCFLMLAQAPQDAATDSGNDILQNAVKSLPVAKPLLTSTPEIYSRSTAILLSLGFTIGWAGIGSLVHFLYPFDTMGNFNQIVARVIIFSLGMSIWPATGDFYAGQWKWALLWSSGRLALVGIVAVTMGLTVIFSGQLSEYSKPKSIRPAIITISVIGGIISLGSIISEMALCDLHIKKVNRRRAISITVAPFILPGPATKIGKPALPAIGLALGTRF
jgi:hypothetical protein